MDYTGPKDNKYLAKEEMQWVWLKYEKIFWLVFQIIYFGGGLISFFKFIRSKLYFTNIGYRSGCIIWHLRIIRRNFWDKICS